jgi:serine/threonine protein kinase
VWVIIGCEYDELADEFIVESEPRRFRYGQLAAATRNFTEDRKLGQGGFGSVYRGFLKELGLEVAIKRVSKGSMQGRREYAATVRTISKLCHRHLVATSTAVTSCSCTSICQTTAST